MALKKSFRTPAELRRWFAKHHETHEELITYLLVQIPRWWMPDATEFVDAIPRTSAGKFLKSALRERFGIFHHLDFYSLEELKAIVARSASILGANVEPDGAAAIAKPPTPAVSAIAESPRSAAASAIE